MGGMLGLVLGLHSMMTGSVPYSLDLTTIFQRSTRLISRNAINCEPVVDARLL
jgi:hypothetical protein